MHNPSFSRVKEVFDQWAMYAAVVEADYMHHTELAQALGDWARKQPAPLRIIDLGCGDAWLATQAFRHADVAEYRGVDVSDSAADLARANTAIWPGRTEIVAGNLADYLHRLPERSRNVVLASYSLHHFHSQAKLELIHDCGRVLEEGGTLIWIDAVRREDESRDAYVDRLTRVMANDWTALTVEQRHKACAHVRESDFPETGRWMIDHVVAAGFLPPKTILQQEFFDGWMFMRA